MDTDMKLPKCQAICKVLEVKSPTHKHFRGWRITAVRPNLEAIHPRTKKRRVSFHSRFHLFIQGDYSRFPTEGQLSLFEERLRLTGININKIHWLVE